MNKFASTLRTAVFAAFLAFMPLAAFAETAAAAPAAGTAVTVAETAGAAEPGKAYFSDKAVLYLSIAISMACGCLAAGYAVGKVGSAVMGAAAERPELLGKAIAYVGLGEGIALFGFLIALFMYTKI